MTRLPGEKPLLGYVMPWRVRLLIVAAVIGVLYLLGVAGWSFLVALAVLIAADRYWLARERREIARRREYNRS